MKGETIIKLFKKYRITNAVDVTEDDIVFKRSDNNSLNESNKNGDINQSDSSENEGVLDIANTSYVNKK